MCKLPSGIFTPETVYNVDWFQLRDAIKKATEIEYELDEVGNDTYHKCHVTSIPTSHDKHIYREMKKEPHVQSHEFESLMSGLCSEGYIAPGTYVINVSW